MTAIPTIDLGGPGAPEAIDRACREVGFFTVTGHGVDPTLRDSLDEAARAFFARPEAEKARWAMALAGTSWRGWFPVGGELTSGVPDRKEGLYFGAEGSPDDRRPLHGPNLFPPGLRRPVLAWMASMTRLGQRLLMTMATGLGLDPGWFEATLTADPVTLFRIFHYPPGGDGSWQGDENPVTGAGCEPLTGADEQPFGAAGPSSSPCWGVAEHTDYGLLTILAQDGTGGLQVRAADGAWLDVPGDTGALVCNLGDMLERLTAGRYRSTPHRVRNTSAVGRLSFPFFLDPSWDAEVVPLPLGAGGGPAPDRWDGADPAAFEGTYGDYLTAKVRRVFPELWPAG